MVRLSMVVGVAVAALAASASAQTVALLPGETLLEVQAEGSATYLPDAAFISAGVVSTGTTAQEATEANARTMADVIAALKRAGVSERYIRTRQISVQPRFARGNATDYEGQASITGYVARNGVSVTVTKLASAPQVIAAAFAAGANSVDGPNLGSQDTDGGMADARDDALANAKAEAEGYARGLGLQVSRVLRVSERGSSTRPVDYIMVTGNRVSGSYAPPPPPPPAPPPPVAGGEMKRTVTVYVDYALSK